MSVGLGRLFASVGLLGLLLAGCTSAGIGGTGSAHLALPAARHVQYLATDLKVLKVTLTHQTSGRTYVQTFPGTSLVAASGASPFRFVAENLPPGSYLAYLEAFVDDAGTLLAGSSTSSPFDVTAYATTPVTLSPMVLAATPIGDWKLTVSLKLTGGYQVTSYESQLQATSGSTVKGPAGTTLASNKNFTWGNVPAYPSGPSTSSITVTATNRHGQSITKTQVATAGIVPAATVSSTVTFAFP